MPEVVIVEAVRSAVGKRRGGLSNCLAPDLFSDVLAGLVARSGIDSSVVGQVTGGCVSQVGQQSGNITRSAWLAGTGPARRRIDHPFAMRLIAAGIHLGLRAGRRRGRGCRDRRRRRVNEPGPNDFQRDARTRTVEDAAV